MGSTNKTTNYELSQFVGSDKPSWLGDYNADMGKIDLAIKARAVEAGQAQASADTANGKADALDTRMDTAEDNILALQNASTTDHTQIATNTANISQNAQDIVQLDAKIGHTQITIGDHTVTGAVAELAARPVTGDADDISYDNTTSGLTATNVQDAIDEIVSGGGVEADDVSYDNTTSGLTATNVQAAIDELANATPQIDETIKYDESTDYVQVKKNGLWVNWVKTTAGTLAELITTPMSSAIGVEGSVSVSGGAIGIAQNGYTANGYTAFLPTNSSQVSSIGCGFVNRSTTPVYLTYTFNVPTLVNAIAFKLCTANTNGTGTANLEVLKAGSSEWTDIGAPITASTSATPDAGHQLEVNEVITAFRVGFKTSTDVQVGIGGLMAYKYV